MKRKVRKRLFIDSKVQGALFRQCALQWIVYVGATLTVLILLQSLLLLPHQLAGDPDASLSKFFSALWYQNILVVAVMLMLLPSWFYNLLKLSHRFAGPVLRLRNEMHRAARGEKVKPIRFRENDFWPELADEFNAMLERLEKQAKGQDASSDGRTDSKVAESQPEEPEHYDEQESSVMLNA